MMINILLRIQCFKTVVAPGLIIEAHILSRTQVFGITLGNMKPGVGTNMNLLCPNLTTTGRNHNHPFCGTAAIKGNSRDSFQKADVLNLTGLYIARIPGHPVNQEEVLVPAPNIPKIGRASCRE